MNIPPILKYQLPLLVWISVIFGISAIPTVPVFKFPISPDKLAHSVIYFILCLLARRAFYYQTSFSWLKRNALLAAFVFTVVYGVMDEIHQLYVPGRWADVYDAIADSLGGLIFVGWFRWKYGKNPGGREPGK